MTPALRARQGGGTAADGGEVDLRIVGPQHLVHDRKQDGAAERTKHRPHSPEQHHRDRRQFDIGRERRRRIDEPQIDRVQRSHRGRRNCGSDESADLEPRGRDAQGLGGILVLADRQQLEAEA
jgi:hypothetical protein